MSQTKCPGKWQFLRAPNVWSAKCLGAKCPRPPIFQGANCPYSQMSRSEMSWVPIVQSANCPDAKCQKRQMSGAKCPGAGWRAPFVSLVRAAFDSFDPDHRWSVFYLIRSYLYLNVQHRWGEVGIHKQTQLALPVFFHLC